jgi:hypothetical protein
MLGYDTLMNHFRTNFTLMQEHKYVLSDIENLMVWEKFIYLDMLRQHIQNIEDMRRDQAAQLKAKRAQKPR